MWILKNGNKEYIDLPPSKLMPNFTPYWEDSANSSEILQILINIFIWNKIWRQIYLEESRNTIKLLNERSDIYKYKRNNKNIDLNKIMYVIF